MEAIERPLGGIHRVVVLPRLRNHHQHRVRQAAAAEVQQLEHLVERRRVTAAGRADRIGAFEAGDHVAGQHRLARTHPVAVALHGVDLAVVGDEPIRVGQRPRRERVGAEAAVHQCHRTLEALVAEVGEEHLQLRRREHPFVDQRAAAERREVGLLFGGQFVLDALAGDEHLAVEVDPGGAGSVIDEQLPAGRQHHPRAGAEAIGIYRNVAPTEHGEALVLDDRLDHRLRLLGISGIPGQERQAHRIARRPSEDRT